MPTISDIARRAGVSKAAVSYALNDPSRLSAETVARIRAIAEELGYMPNPVARSMSLGRTGTIGVLVPQPLPEMLRNPFFSQFLEGVAIAAARAELPILLVPPVRGSVERAVSSAAVDGFLTLGLETFRPTMHVLERRRLPYVMVDSEPVEGVTCVNVDDEGGAYQAMRHILDHGHRR
ncbi:MAG: alanine racemase, partial [Chloroflexota bacterium]